MPVVKLFIPGGEDELNSLSILSALGGTGRSMIQEMRVFLEKESSKSETKDSLLRFFAAEDKNDLFINKNPASVKSLRNLVEIKHPKKATLLDFADTLNSNWIEKEPLLNPTQDRALRLLRQSTKAKRPQHSSDTALFASELRKSHRSSNEATAISAISNLLSYSDGKYTFGDIVMTEDEIAKELTQEAKEFSVVMADTKLTNREKWEAFNQQHWLMPLVFTLLTLIFANQIAKLGDYIVEEALPKAFQFFASRQRIAYVHNEASAKIYKKADTESAVLTKAKYASELIILDDSVKFWRKIEFIDETGNEIIGWVAKKNITADERRSFRSNLAN